MSKEYKLYISGYGYIPKTAMASASQMSSKVSKKAIVSFANERGNYIQALHRLEESLKGRFDGDFFGFIGEESVGAPKHDENPYAFKIYAIDKVRREGYDQILYLDSSCYAIEDLQPIFDVIERKGYFMQEAGAYASDWTNDFTLDYFKITREEAKSIFLYSAGITGLDFRIPQVCQFFDEWRMSMLMGCFKGEWTDHRHDLSAASIIATRLGFEYEKGDQYVQYAAPETPKNNDSVVLKLQGI